MMSFVAVVPPSCWYASLTLRLASRSRWFPPFVALMPKLNVENLLSLSVNFSVRERSRAFWISFSFRNASSMEVYSKAMHWLVVVPLLLLLGTFTNCTTSVSLVFLVAPRFASAVKSVFLPLPPLLLILPLLCLESVIAHEQLASFASTSLAALRPLLRRLLLLLLLLSLPPPFVAVVVEEEEKTRSLTTTPLARDIRCTARTNRTTLCSPYIKLTHEMSSRNTTV
mmetsp:Transcript_6038/g.20243  ORF Transcript_6038/g.20243 Transcript_6038/m.20243 type:complete len:226 (+) Transcript_6038:261-938(+)